MSRLSCLLLVLTLMACSAASTKKEIKEGKVIASKDESMTRRSLFGIKNRGSLFGIGSIIKNKIQNKKNLISTIIAKKKSIKYKRSVVDSAAPPKEDMDIGKMLANADTSKTRRSLFGIGRLIQQKIHNKKKLFSTIVAKKKSIKNKILSKISNKYWY